MHNVSLGGLELIFTYARTRRHSRVQAHVHTAHMFVFVYKNIHTRIHTHASACTHRYAHTGTHTNISLELNVLPRIQYVT